MAEITSVVSRTDAIWVISSHKAGTPFQARVGRTRIYKKFCVERNCKIFCICNNPTMCIVVNIQNFRTKIKSSITYFFSVVISKWILKYFQRLKFQIRFSRLLLKCNHIDFSHVGLPLTSCGIYVIVFSACCLPYSLWQNIPECPSAHVHTASPLSSRHEPPLSHTFSQ